MERVESIEEKCAAEGTAASQQVTCVNRLDSILFFAVDIDRDGLENRSVCGYSRRVLFYICPKWRRKIN